MWKSLELGRLCGLGLSHLEAGDSGVTVIVLLEKSVGIAGCFQIPPFEEESLQGRWLGNHLPSFIPVSKSPRTQVLGTPRISPEQEGHAVSSPGMH